MIRIGKGLYSRLVSTVLSTVAGVDETYNYILGEMIEWLLTPNFSYQFLLVLLLEGKEIVYEILSEHIQKIDWMIQHHNFLDLYQQWSSYGI